MITIRTYSENAPYWEPTIMAYQAASLKDVLFHTRLAMEDGEDYIAAFNEDGTCYGLWEGDSEPVFDQEMGWFVPRKVYLLRRPGGPMAGQFNSIVRLFS